MIVTFASLNFSCEPALDIFCYIFLKVNTIAYKMSEYFSIKSDRCEILVEV